MLLEREINSTHCLGRPPNEWNQLERETLQGFGMTEEGLVVYKIDLRGGRACFCGCTFQWKPGETISEPHSVKGEKTAGLYAAPFQNPYWSNRWWDSEVGKSTRLLLLLMKPDAFLSCNGFEVKASAFTVLDEMPRNSERAGRFLASSSFAFIEYNFSLLQQASQKARSWDDVIEIFQQARGHF